MPSLVNIELNYTQSIKGEIEGKKGLTSSIKVLMISSSLRGSLVSITRLLGSQR